MSMSSSSSASDGGSGMDKLFRVVTCSLPFSFFKKGLLYLFGSQGCNWQSLAVDIVEVVLPGSDEDLEEDSVMLDDTEMESLEVIVNGELNGEQHDEGDEGPGDVLRLGLLLVGTVQYHWLK